MSATPDQVWELISDVTQIGKYSPETFEAEWTDGATGPAVGARFRGHVKRNGRGPIYWSPCKVLVADPGKEFRFAVVGPKDRAINTWGYKLQATGGGTDVTEFFELAGLMKPYWLVMGHWRGRTNRNGMQTTLERIKAVVEEPETAS